MSKERNMKTTKTERLAAQITDFRNRSKLNSWSSFIEELQVPSDLYPDMMTQRSALMPKGRALTADECQIVYKLIAGLMDTNAALSEHTQQTAILVGEWNEAFKGLKTLAGHINTFANLKDEDETEIEEAA